MNLKPWFNERTLRASLSKGGTVDRHGHWHAFYVWDATTRPVGRVNFQVWRRVRPDLEPAGDELPRNGAKLRLRENPLGR